MIQLKMSTPGHELHRGEVVVADREEDAEQRDHADEDVAEQDEHARHRRHEPAQPDHDRGEDHRHARRHRVVHEEELVDREDAHAREEDADQDQPHAQEGAAAELLTGRRRQRRRGVPGDDRDQGARDDERDVEGQRGCLVAHAEGAEVLLPPLRVAGAQHRGERADHEERREHEREQHRREVHRRQERHVGGEGEGDAREDRAREREHDGADEALLEHVGQADPPEQRDHGVRDRERRDVEPVQAGAGHVEPGRRVVEHRRVPVPRDQDATQDERDERRHRPADADVLPEGAGPGDREVAPPERDERDHTSDREERRPEEQRDRFEGFGTGGRMPQHPGDRRRFGHEAPRSLVRPPGGRSRRPSMPVAIARVHDAARHEGDGRDGCRGIRPRTQESVGSSTSSIEPCTKPAHS